MKKQVLFVDDEEMVLQGLQRTMRAMRNDWDMTFVDSTAPSLLGTNQTCSIAISPSGSAR